MSEYAIITENDESPWSDVKGDIYHYPNKYSAILEKGCKVIYYKGRMTNRFFQNLRLSPDPHYFGVAEIGDSILDPDNSKNKFCEILTYQEFKSPVPIKNDSGYFEEIPKSRENNYWRDGVRAIDIKVYEAILKGIDVKDKIPRLPNLGNEFESTGVYEGQPKARFTTYYERSPINRKKAIEIHGLNCKVCGFNFYKTYGELGTGFIHVHHNKPVSTTGHTVVNPGKDLDVLCANCHSMIHRKKNHTFSVNELKNKMLKI